MAGKSDPHLWEYSTATSRKTLPHCAIGWFDRVAIGTAVARFTELCKENGATTNAATTTATWTTVKFSLPCGLGCG